MLCGQSSCLRWSRRSLIARTGFCFCRQERVKDGAFGRELFSRFEWARFFSLTTNAIYVKLADIMPEQWKPLTGLDELSQPKSAPVPPPQFAKAEYAQPVAGQSGALRCPLCAKSITNEYFALNGHPVCPECAANARAGQAGDSHAAYAQALLYGAGAALAGFVFYAGFTIVTHFYIGYVALAVGWMVAKAMMTGSNGVGGTRYQITACVLTYAAISLASIPIHIAYLAPSSGSVDWVSELPELLMLGIFSPFLALTRGLGGLIGLVILGVGIRVAWRMTKARRLAVTGPHYNKGPIA